MRPHSRGKPEVAFRTDVLPAVAAETTTEIRVRASPFARWLGTAALLILFAAASHGVGVFNRFSPMDELFVPSLRTSLVSTEKGRDLFRVISDVWSDPASNPRFAPLTYTSFVVEYRLFAGRPGGYHAVSILWHAINTLLLWTLLSKLGVRASFFASVVFAIHPVTVDAVAWIAQRPTLQSAGFSLACMIVLLRWTGISAPPEGYSFVRLPGSRGILYGIAIVLLALAGLSGPMGLCVVPAIMVIAWWRRCLPAPRDFAAMLALLLIPVAAAALDIASQWAFLLNEPDVPRVFDAAIVSGRAVLGAVMSTVAPIGLSFYYPDWSLRAPAMACLVAAAALATALSLLLVLPRNEKKRALLVLVGLIFSALLPALIGVDIIRFRITQVADHTAYFATAVIIGFAVASIASWLEVGSLTPRTRRVLPIAIAAIVATALSTITALHARNYRNAATLWERAQARHPKDLKPHLRLAELYLFGGAGIEPDLSLAERYVRGAIAVEPRDNRVIGALARLYLQQDELDKAIAQYVIALSSAPDDIRMRGQYAIALERAGQHDAAVAQYDQVLAAKPDDVTALNNLGNLYASLGDVIRAEEYFRRAIAGQPRFAPAYINLSTVLDRQGRLKEAVAALQKVVFEIDRNNVDAWMQAGLLANKAGDLESGERFARQAVSLRPDLAEPLNLLGIICLRRGKIDESAMYFRFAIERDPDNMLYRQNLDVALRARPGRPPDN